jgi:hypothetical protein
MLHMIFEIHILIKKMEEKNWRLRPQMQLFVQLSRIVIKKISNWINGNSKYDHNIDPRFSDLRNSVW